MNNENVSQNEAVFHRFYQEGLWQKDGAGAGTSGPGSTLLEGFPFILLLNQFLATHTIQSVVDIGCGDWVLAQQVNWESRTYIGIDIVKSIIDRNNLHYRSASKRFIQCDITQETFPYGDLLICKDVLIHLPLQDVMQCLNQAKQFKYALFVNDIDANNSSQNRDIVMGYFRPLNLTLPPFNLCFQHQATYISGNTVKQILVV